MPFPFQAARVVRSVEAALRGDVRPRDIVCRSAEPLTRRSQSLFLALLILLGPSARAQLPSAGSAVPFHEGDRVCFIGDSITHTGSYPTLVALFYATRFPERRITWLNAGISGDRAAAIVANENFRLKTDILARRATVATVMLGMNDVGRGDFGSGKSGENVLAAREKNAAVYKTAMTTLLSRVQETGARLILFTPSPYDDATVHPVMTARFMSSGRDNALGAGSALERFSELIRGWAKERHAGLADVNALMTAVNRREQARDPNFTVVSVDRIHPGVVGHFLMAYTLLKAQGLEGPVATIAIDASAGEVNRLQNASVTDVRREGMSLRFSVQEKALPFPVPTEAQSALALVPFTREFNQEILQVAGLKAGRYRLVVDEVTLGEFPSDELAGGVDLAALPLAPQVKQAAEAGRIAAELMEAVLKLRDAATNFYVASKAGVNVSDAAALRTYADQKSAELTAAKKEPDLRFRRFLEALAEPGKFEREEAHLTEALRKACQPSKHQYVLLPI